MAQYGKPPKEPESVGTGLNLLGKKFLIVYAIIGIPLLGWAGLAIIPKVLNAITQVLPKPIIEQECIMNGYGQGHCSFTNIGKSSGSVCGKIVVNHDDGRFKFSMNSSQFCSGPVENNSTNKIDFNIPSVSDSCKATEYSSWNDICSFQFVKS